MIFNSLRSRSKGLGSSASWIALLTLGLPVFAGAQAVYPNSMPQRGITSGPAYTFDKLKTINTVNGSLIYTIPLAQLPPGRAGFSKPFSLIYNSQIYDLGTSFEATQNSSGSTIQVSRLQGSIYGSWRYSYQYGLDLERKPGSATVTCNNPPPGQWDQYKLRLITPDGGPPELSIYGVRLDPNGNGYYPFDPTGAGFCGNMLSQDMTYYTTDGTHIRVVVSHQGPTSGQGGQNAWVQHQWTAYFPDGSTVTGKGQQTTSMSDRSGNTITVATYHNADNSPSNVLTDQFGRAITIQHNGLQDVITQTGFGGQAVTATVNQGGVILDPNQIYECSPAGDSCHAYGPVTTVTSVSLGSPGNDTQNYSFGYSDQTVKGWGQLRTVQLPSGAKVTYSYQMMGSRSITYPMLRPLCSTTRSRRRWRSGRIRSMAERGLLERVCLCPQQPSCVKLARLPLLSLILLRRKAIRAFEGRQVILRPERAHFVF